MGCIEKSDFPFLLLFFLLVRRRVRRYKKFSVSGRCTFYFFNLYFKSFKVSNEKQMEKLNGNLR